MPLAASDAPRLLLESVAVGLYVSALYLASARFHGMGASYLFALGFAKHLAGYLTGLHGYYCRRGLACARAGSAGGGPGAAGGPGAGGAAGGPMAGGAAGGPGEAGGPGRATTALVLIADSALEGLLFCAAGRAAGLFRSRLAGFFFVGAALHVAAELLLVHALFCRLRCPR